MTVSLLSVWQHAREFGRVDVRHGGGAPQPAFAFGALAAENMLFERLASEKLASLGSFEPLCGATVRLQFRHLTPRFNFQRAGAGFAFPL
jgi:hypothetical protein